MFEKSYATAYGSGPDNGQPVAGKTGTGVEFRDHWLVGYCPQLCCAAWIGNRDYSSTSEYLTANSLWHNFMTMALSGTDIVNFPTVEAPTYTNQSQTMQETTQEDNVAAEIGSYSAGSLSESDVMGMYTNYEMRISYTFSSDYPDGAVISMSLDRENGVVYVVVSQGADPAQQQQEQQSEGAQQGESSQESPPS